VDRCLFHDKVRNDPFPVLSAVVLAGLVQHVPCLPPDNPELDL
jgi:hypothetical protein